jgi:PAS domain-containing protein
MPCRELVWTAQPDGEVDFVNQRWREYTGISSDGAAGWAWQSAIHPDDLPGLLDHWRFLLLSRKPGEVEARLRRFDVVFRWFLIRVLPSRDEHGQVLKWYGQNVDRESESNAARPERAEGINSETSHRLLLAIRPGVLERTRSLTWRGSRSPT